MSRALNAIAEAAARYLEAHEGVWIDGGSVEIDELSDAGDKLRAAVDAVGTDAGKTIGCDNVDAFAESPAERVDATARELFVREIERQGGVTVPLDDTAKTYARCAYELAAILESARVKR